MPSKSVLLVEADTDSRLMLRTILRRAGYVVLEAADGADALKVAAEQAPDLIFLSISLPSDDGWNVAHLLRSAPGTAAVPMVAITALDTADDRGQAVRPELNGYLRKPVDPFEVARVAEELIGPGARPEGSERRRGVDRRVRQVEVAVERRSGNDRRGRSDRRVPP